MLLHLHPSLLTVMNSQFTRIFAVSPCENSLVLGINLISAFHQSISWDSCAVPEPRLVLHSGYSSLLYSCFSILSITSYINTLLPILCASVT